MSQVQPPIYVVSLARDVERRESITRRLDELGLVFNLVDAVDARESDKKWLHAQVNHEAVLRLLGRPLSDSEIGCALSHRRVYRNIIDSGQVGALVLEDDVLVQPTFPEVALWFGGVATKLANKPTVFQLDVMSRAPGQHLVLRRRAAVQATADVLLAPLVLRLSHEPWGTCSYYVTRAAAESLLAPPRVETVADHWSEWARRASGNVYVALPAPVIHPPITGPSHIEHLSAGGLFGGHSIIRRAFRRTVGRAVRAIANAVL